MVSNELQFVKHRVEAWDSKGTMVTVYGPDPHEKWNFVDRFSNQDTNLGNTTTLVEIEGIGLREVSTRVLAHWAIYMAHQTEKNFRRRKCHIFGSTFYLDDAMVDKLLSRDALRPIAREIHSIAKRKPELNEVIGMISARDKIVIEHSMVTATDHRDGQVQLSASKLDDRPIYLHTWRAAKEIYPDSYEDFYAPYKGVRGII